MLRLFNLLLALQYVLLLLLIPPCKSYYYLHYKTSKPIHSTNNVNSNQIRNPTFLGSIDATSISHTPTPELSSEETIMHQKSLHQPQIKTGVTSFKTSEAAKWHKERRREMVRRHGDTITSLESKRSLPITLPILLGSNAILTFLSIYSGSLNLLHIFGTAFVFGSIFSLWQLQLLHEVLHGAMLGNGTLLHRRFAKPLLFWCSFPCAFGYWLYMQYGHLSHHKSFGAMSLESVFDDSTTHLGDGDMLFVNHRMKLKGGVGPKMKFPWNHKKEKATPISIGTFIFHKWKNMNYLFNSVLFSCSFLFERVMLVMNDVVVAFCGRNYFFPNKPKEFHDDCTKYARAGLLVRSLLCYLAAKFNPHTTALFTLKPILFLMLCETLWSLPPHPACAMFITNHGSSTSKNQSCVPTSSTYAGKWYSIYTMGTNYHTEHHDFPTMPLHLLGKLRYIVGTDFYREEKNDNLLKIMKKTFGRPEFYACSNDVGSLQYHFDDTSYQ